MKRVIFEADRGITFILWPEVDQASFVDPLSNFSWCGSFGALERLLRQALGLRRALQVPADSDKGEQPCQLLL